MTNALACFPSSDEVLRTDEGRRCVDRFGHQATLAAIRSKIGYLRTQIAKNGKADFSRPELLQIVTEYVVKSLLEKNRPGLRRVHNLTGTILHTNLGRAQYASAAVEAASEAMQNPLALEFDLDTGKRGKRDNPVKALIMELTGAEDACVVNNNASAVLLVLAALGHDRETVVSRGELIEIGGSFRMPDIMAAAGTRLREVGTTNRTHPSDFRNAIGPDTALLMKVHTSNFRLQGFVRETRVDEMSEIAGAAGVPLVDDLGSGTLVDLSRWGLRRERTVQQSLSEGADIVTFSGDKLLGGPQAGFIVGRRDLVKACASHPIKRAVRLDKVRLAALEASLKLYRDPDRLAKQLPTFAHFAKEIGALKELAFKLRPILMTAFEEEVDVHVVDTQCQIGSGALPLDTIPSVALRLETGGGGEDKLAATLRKLPVPVIGRIERGAVMLDLRCLDDVTDFVDQFSVPIGKQHPAS